MTTKCLCKKEIGSFISFRTQCVSLNLKVLDNMSKADPLSHFKLGINNHPPPPPPPPPPPLFYKLTDTRPEYLMLFNENNYVKFCLLVVGVIIILSKLSLFQDNIKNFSLDLDLALSQVKILKRVDVPCKLKTSDLWCLERKLSVYFVEEFCLQMHRWVQLIIKTFPGLDRAYLFTAAKILFLKMPILLSVYMTLQRSWMSPFFNGCN